MNTTELTIHHAHGSSDPPFTKLSLDWFGERVRPSAEFSLSFEDDRLVFRSRRQKGALCQPGAEEGQFFEGLWFHDVAELFVSDPITGHYLEVNLSPRGAYWACIFDAPRRRVAEVRSCGAQARGMCREGQWEARVDLPLAWMRSHRHFGLETRFNVPFILDSPSQRILSEADLGGGDPDFHRPAGFLQWREEGPLANEEAYSMT